MSLPQLTTFADADEHAFPRHLVPVGPPPAPEPGQMWWDLERRCVVRVVRRVGAHLIAVHVPSRRSYRKREYHDASWFDGPDPRFRIRSAR